MGGGDEDANHRILFLGRHAGAALAAAMLGPVRRERGALDVAGVGDGDDHVLARDQVLVLEIGLALHDLGAAGDGEGVAHLAQFLADDVQHPGA